VDGHAGPAWPACCQGTAGAGPGRRRPGRARNRPGRGGARAPAHRGRSEGGGAVGNGGAAELGHLRGGGGRWHRLGAPPVDSFISEEEGVEGNLVACLVARGKVGDGGALRRPWRRARAPLRESRGEGEE
jgi:hypothetical protein